MLQGMKDARVTEEEKTCGDLGRGSAQLPADPTTTQQLPPALAALGQGEFPLECWSCLAWPLLLQRLCHNYPGLDSPRAALLSRFPRKPGRVPCFQGQLNSPRNLTHNFHLAQHDFAAGDWAGLGGLLTLLWCCHSQRVSGWQNCLPTRAPLDRETPLN